jgi:hypothetical protein
MTANDRFPRLLSLSLGAAVALAAASGCGGTSVAAPVAEPPAVPEPSADETPAPLAKIDFVGGQAVEFYEIGGNAVVSETGAAGQSTVLGGMPELRANRLVDLWRQLAPERAAPASLVDLQARLLTAKAADVARPVRIEKSVVPAYGGVELAEIAPPLDDTGETLAAPVGCNNGCCDYDWLKTFAACQSADYSWFLYNYGWSYGNVSDAVLFNGMACAAQGNSTYKVSVEGGKGGTWTVLEAHYRTYWVLAPVCCNDPDIKTSVNSSTNQHLHTHCGQTYK